MESEWSIDLHEIILRFAEKYRDSAKRQPMWIRNPADVHEWLDHMHVMANDQVLAVHCPQIWHSTEEADLLQWCRLDRPEVIGSRTLPICTGTMMHPAGLMVFADSLRADETRHCGLLDFSDGSIETPAGILEFYRALTTDEGHMFPYSMSLPSTSCRYGLVSYFQHFTPTREKLTGSYFAFSHLNRGSTSWSHN